MRTFPSSGLLSLVLSFLLMSSSFAENPSYTAYIGSTDKAICVQAQAVQYAGPVTCEQLQRLPLVRSPIPLSSNSGSQRGTQCKRSRLLNKRETISVRVGPFRRVLQRRHGTRGS